MGHPLASNRAASGDPTGHAAAAIRVSASAVAQVGTGPSEASVSYSCFTSGVSSFT